jgi:hypothetical protein
MAESMANNTLLRIEISAMFAAWDPGNTKVSLMAEPAKAAPIQPRTILDV